MSRVLRLLGRIPLLPTRKSLGQRLVGRDLNSVRGDADVLGVVLSNRGWEFVPADIEADGEDQYAVPVDGSDEYPADGIDSDPATLFGCPIAVGYRDFATLNQVTNVQVARDVYVDSLAVTDGGDRDDDPLAESDASSDEGRGLRDRLRGLFTRGSSGEDAAPEASTERRSLRSRIRSRLGDIQHRLGWRWLQGGASSLTLQQDGDAAWVMERSDYQVGRDLPDWFVTRGSGYRFDARGAGGKPNRLGPADVGMAFAPVPKLLSPVTCRIARNLHERRFEDEEQSTYGGAVRHAETGQALATDGGHMTIEDPKQATAEYGDVQVEERAFVSPEDIKLLGGVQETQDKIETLLKQTEAKENVPGGGMMSSIVDYGKIVLAFIIGSVLGGGGGGGSISELSPMMIPVTDVATIATAVPL